MTQIENDGGGDTPRPVADPAVAWKAPGYMHGASNPAKGCPACGGPSVGFAISDVGHREGCTLVEDGERWRRASITLNSVGWKLAQALGVAGDHDEEITGDPLAMVTQLVDQLNELRRDVLTARRETRAARYEAAHAPDPIVAGAHFMMLASVPLQAIVWTDHNTGHRMMLDPRECALVYPNHPDTPPPVYDRAAQRGVAPGEVDVARLDALRAAYQRAVEDSGQGWVEHWPNRHAATADQAVKSTGQEWLGALHAAWPTIRAHLVGP